MDRPEALNRLKQQRIGRLATVTPGGGPHVVPITFAVVGETVVTAVDHKPKTTRRLQRLVNLDANPNATLLVDHYSGNWNELWWVRVDGPTKVLDDHPEASAALEAKYVQYDVTPPDGPFIVLSVERVIWWANTP